ncbi:LptF/LptG family permease [Blattabacterium cuenoti]|uniref:LptF/LptG family permease n=1 Tax=Blattabacterium cuenoti TaxID=1653831 RepID=UPI00163C6E93|nr:LptF/LptG family permease [Blattabacterium cuenoti]
MLKKIDIYIIRLFIIPFLFIFSTIFIVFMIQFFWSKIDELTGKNIDILIILKFIFYFGITIIPLAIPITILLSSIITFGEFSENQELIIIKSSGISIFRIMKPILFLTFFLSVGLYFFSDFVVPKAKIEAMKLGYKIALSNSNYKLKEGAFVNLFPDFFIKIDKKDKKNNMYNVFIFFYGKNYLVNTIFSKKGIIINKEDNLFQLKLNNGIFYTENSNELQEKPSYKIINFDTLIQKFKITSKNISNIRLRDNFQILNTKELIEKINILKLKKNYFNKTYLAKHQLELQKKFTFSVTCIIMFLIGAPIGSIFRKGGIGYPTIIAIIIFIIYYVLLTITQNMAEKCKISAWMGAWIPNLLFLPISIWITYKTVMDDFFYKY